MVKTKDFFEAIKEFPHNVGIYLTFTLNTQVIDKLADATSGSILILHDYTQGKKIVYNDNSRIVCLPVKTNNCFHPKLALLKGEKSAKIIVGSTNLSTKSFINEKEIAYEIIIKYDDPDELNLFMSIIEYISRFKKHPLINNSRAFNDTLSKLEYKKVIQTNPNANFCFVHNLDKSIFQSLKSFIQKQKKSTAVCIKIATPFISKEYSENDFKELKKISPNISIYLRDGAYIEPFKLNNFEILQPHSKIKKRKNFHSKIVLIEYEKNAVLFIGSANFTMQGFFNTIEQGANMECGMLLYLDNKNEMDTWFDNKLWEHIEDEKLINYIPEKDNSLNELIDAETGIYAWAELIHKKTIKTFIYNPTQLSVFQNNKQIVCVEENKDLKLFSTNKLKADKNDKITFKVGDSDITIVVFDFEEYKDSSDRKGESLLANFYGLRSISPSKLKEAIKDESISLSFAKSQVKITQPVFLEQQFKNIFYFTKVLIHKEIFWENQINEIKKIIDDETNTSSSLFITYYFLNELIKANKHLNIQIICLEKIKNMLNKHKEFDSIKINMLKEVNENQEKN
ncbi:MAG: hypothetical protein Q8M15_08495 [Bacteroidota bacterium]|nr:hypothetical protein [Bacteroidota bacterium]